MSVPLPKSASDLRWFVSDGAHIAIDLCASAAVREMDLLNRDISPVNDLVDMVLLDELELLLSCLEDCSARRYTWRPLRLRSNVSNTDDGAIPIATGLHELQGVPRLTATLSLQQDATQRLFLAMDTEVLQGLLPLPEPWQSLVVFTHHVQPSRLHLQYLSLSDDQLDKLMPGALLLLPASFELPWPIMIHRNSDIGHCARHPGQGHIDIEEDYVRLLPPSDEDKAAVSGQWQGCNIVVELEEPLLLNELYAQSVWQSRQNMVIALPRPMTQCRVVVYRLEKSSDTATEYHQMTGTERRWSGTVIKVGKGYGVLLA